MISWKDHSKILFDFPRIRFIGVLQEVGINVLENQTWNKARKHGHCPQIFLRIVEISGLLKIDYSYFGRKLMNCENFLLTIKYLAYL